MGIPWEFRIYLMPRSYTRETFLSTWAYPNLATVFRVFSEFSLFLGHGFRGIFRGFFLVFEPWCPFTAALTACSCMLRYFHVLPGALQQCLAELQDAEERFGSQDLRVIWQHATSGQHLGGASRFFAPKLDFFGGRIGRIATSSPPNHEELRVGHMGFRFEACLVKTAIAPGFRYFQVSGLHPSHGRFPRSSSQSWPWPWYCDHSWDTW